MGLPDGYQELQGTLIAQFVSVRQTHPLEILRPHPVQSQWRSHCDRLLMNMKQLARRHTSHARSQTECGHNRRTNQEHTRGRD